MSRQLKEMYKVTRITNQTEINRYVREQVGIIHFQSETMGEYIGYLLMLSEVNADFRDVIKKRVENI